MRMRELRSTKEGGWYVIRDLAKGSKMDGGREVRLRDGLDFLVMVVKIEHRWGLRWVWSCLMVNMRALRSVKEDGSEVERYLAIS
jgi:hypothetical protein